MYTIREFNYSDSDYEGVVAVHNAEWSDNPTAVENCKFDDKNHNLNYLNRRFVVERTGDDSGEKRIIASCSVWESPWSYVAGKYTIVIVIYPEFVGRDIEAALYSHAVAFLSQRDPAPIMFDTYAREDRTALVNFWTDRGFKIVLREPVSELTVTDYDFSRFDGAFDKVSANGIEVASLPTLQARFSDWQQRVYEIIIAIENDAPSTDVQTPQSLEEFAREFNHPCFLADAHFFALDGDRWVGVSTLWKDSGKEDNLKVGITGVLRRHRRKGIATALKLKTIEYAINYGAVTIKTDNEEKNPMYDLNLMLGFKPKPAWLEMRKIL